MPELTEQQRQAVSLRGVSVGVSAGAGSGKTRVLTERFLAEVKELMDSTASGDGSSAADVGAILRQLVAITFTQRAARELSQRVRKLCEEEVRRLGARGKAWLHLWRTIDFARIGTIHSFCGQILRHHGAIAQVDPEFDILDEAVSDVLVAQIVNDLLQERLAQLDEDVMRVSRELGADRAAQVIAQLVVERFRWMACPIATDPPEGLLGRWMDYLRRRRVEALRQFLDSEALQTLCEIARNHPTTSPILSDRLKQILESTERLKALINQVNGRSDEFQKELENLHSAAKVQGVGKSHGWSADVYNCFRDQAEVVRAGCAELANLMQLPDDKLPEAAEIACRIFRLARQAIDRYEKLKQQEASLDYSDLVVKAREVVEAFATCRQTDDPSLGIRLLLVDEFQDTDRDQEALIRSLCGDELTRGKLFFVGDYKQSIYRFRRADPEVFRRLREAIPPPGRLSLTWNFRSQPAILSFVNALFCEALGPDYESLTPYRPQVNKERIVEFLWAIPQRSTPEGTQPKVSVEELRRLEADKIAWRLRRMFDNGEKLVTETAVDKEQAILRPVRPGDVVILFRTLSNIELYEKALRNWGIDYYLVGGQAFYAQQEIYDLLHLLRAISDPADAFSLAGVLRSPFFSCEDEVLWHLGHAPEGFINAFYSQNWPPGLSPTQREKLIRARQTLVTLRELKDSLPVAELIQRALELTGYDALLLTEFLGERKLANLVKLVELARQFDRPNLLGLDAFVARLSDYVARQPVEPLAPLFWETADVVRLMTVHQAKGLEFPVVIVADLARSARGPRELVLFSDEIGPFVRCQSLAPTLGQLLSKAEEEENLRELTRLFYVACTRAADYLILSSALTDLENPKGPWIELLASRFCLTTGKLRDGISYRGPVPTVNVLIEPPERTAPNLVPQTLTAKEIRERLQDSAAEKADQKDLLRYLPVIDIDSKARRELSFTLLRRAFSPVLSAKDLPSEESQAGRPSLPVKGSTIEDGEEETVDRLLAELTRDEAGPAAIVGSFVHEVLSYIDFGQPSSLSRWIGAVLPRYEPLPEPVEELEALIGRFLDSPRAKAIAQASQLLREVEFLLPLPDEFLVTSPGKRVPYIRGFFDCLYADRSGQWILVDYKTNQISAEQVAATAELYRLQMNIYGLAAQHALGIPPAEVVLYFLRPGSEFSIPWTDEVAREAEATLRQLVRRFYEAA